MALEGNIGGDFAMYLYERADQDPDQPTRVARYTNEKEMRADANRLKKGGRFKRIWIGRWDYDDEADTNEIDDWREGDE